VRELNRDSFKKVENGNENFVHMICVVCCCYICVGLCCLNAPHGKYERCLANYWRKQCLRFFRWEALQYVSVIYALCIPFILCCIVSPLSVIMMNSVEQCF